MTESAADRIERILSGITYKAGWSIVSSMVSQPWMQWKFEAKDVKGGGFTMVTGRKWLISTYMVESEIVSTCLLAALQAEEHECREAFRYKNKQVFNPHVDIRELLKVCEKEDIRG